MSVLLRTVRRTGLVQTSLAIWYAVFASWGLLNLVFPPSQPLAALGGLFLIVAVLACATGFLAMTGAFLVKQPRAWGTLGLLLEQVGLLGMQAANVSYLFVVIALALGPGTDWYARIAYVVGVSAAMGVRQTFLLPKYRAIGATPNSATVIVH